MSEPKANITKPGIHRKDLIQPSSPAEGRQSPRSTGQVDLEKLEGLDEAIDRIVVGASHSFAALLEIPILLARHNDKGR